jgi:large subunit ribosomal protein L6
MPAERKVEIPDEVTVTLDGSKVQVKGPKGELERSFRYPNVTLRYDEDEFVVSTSSDRKRIVAMCGTFASHVRNMCRGVTEGYEYRMKVVYSHFPIQLKQTGDQIEIINFLGEKQSRFARIMDGVDVNLGNDEIVITGIDKEAVGSTAARIERATKVRNKDPRVFQDGIYIVERV